MSDKFIGQCWSSVEPWPPDLKRPKVNAVEKSFCYTKKLLAHHILLFMYSNYAMLNL